MKRRERAAAAVAADGAVSVSPRRRREYREPPSPELQSPRRVARRENTSPPQFHHRSKTPPPGFAFSRSPAGPPPPLPRRSSVSPRRRPLRNELAADVEEERGGRSPQFRRRQDGKDFVWARQEHLSPREQNGDKIVPFTIGNFVKDRWLLIKRLGCGSFGETYEAVNRKTKARAAVKIEFPGRNTMHIECNTLNALQPLKKTTEHDNIQYSSLHARYVPALYECGEEKSCRFIVMELLGPSVSHLKEMTPYKRFSLSTTLRLGLRMLNGIEYVHERGYLHRDIKPSNFVMGLGEMDVQNCYLIDFGEARQYRMKNGTNYRYRDRTSFRGTIRYASINSHKQKDLCRYDDLWSWLFVMIEFLTGTLPWKGCGGKENREEICRIKEREIVNNTLFQHLPGAFLHIAEELKGCILNYEEYYLRTPDYSYIRNVLSNLCAAENIHKDDPYDWEEGAVVELYSPHRLEHHHHHHHHQRQVEVAGRLPRTTASPHPRSASPRSPLPRPVQSPPRQQQQRIPPPSDLFSPDVFPPDVFPPTDPSFGWEEDQEDDTDDKTNCCDDGCCCCKKSEKCKSCFFAACPFPSCRRQTSSSEEDVADAATYETDQGQDKQNLPPASLPPPPPPPSKSHQLSKSSDSRCGNFWAAVYKRICCCSAFDGDDDCPTASNYEDEFYNHHHHHHQQQQHSHHYQQQYYQDHRHHHYHQQRRQQQHYQQSPPPPPPLSPPPSPRYR